VLHKKSGVIRLRSTEKTAARSYYYSFRDKSGRMNALIEKWFNPVENEFIKLRQHLRDHIEEINLKGTASDLDPKYRRLLAEYVYIHVIRVPSMFDEIKRQAANFQAEVAARHGLPIDENDAQVLALRTMIRMGQSPGMNIVDALMRRTLDVEFFPRTRISLATCDTPVMMYDESRAPGLAYDSTTVFFSLDSSVMLRFAEFGNEIKMIKQRDMSQATYLARLAGARAQDEVYCRDPAVLKQVAEYLKAEGKIEGSPEVGATS
jgi:AcrR family transcriptional regulator